ncbi:hypothetical protein [Trinickia acidisoli]|uniref:hypothetical protein n=1 Tax=Trinickia acidisoli TaxID=2767482 RepID=UPI001F5D390C|nr:hypothetical protein [Trinickia acidisoli]
MVRLLDELAIQEDFVEYYWRPGQNAVLMFDTTGNPSAFVAWDADEWAFQCDTVIDAGGPQWLREGMIERRIMPLFWPHEAYSAGLSDVRTTDLKPIPDWEGAFYSLTPLDATAIEPGMLTFAKWRQTKRETLRIAGAR